MEEIKHGRMSTIDPQYPEEKLPILKNKTKGCPVAYHSTLRFSNHSGGRHLQVVHHERRLYNPAFGHKFQTEYG